MSAPLHARGATLTFSGGFTATIISKTGGGKTWQKAPTTPLSAATGPNQSRQSANYDDDPFTLTFFWDPSQTFADLPDDGAETVTLTYVLESGQTTAAKESGTAYLLNLTKPDMVADDPQFMLASMTVQPDGVTAWTDTAGS